jgi:hypothetical protein
LALVRRVVYCWTGDRWCRNPWSEVAPLSLVSGRRPRPPSWRGAP